MHAKYKEAHFLEKTAIYFNCLSRQLHNVNKLPTGLIGALFHNFEENNSCLFWRIVNEIEGGFSEGKRYEDTSTVFIGYQISCLTSCLAFTDMSIAAVLAVE